MYTIYLYSFAFPNVSRRSSDEYRNISTPAVPYPPFVNNNNNNDNKTYNNPRLDILTIK